MQSSEALQDVIRERQRQLASEGFSLERDDQYKLGELAAAGGRYALFAQSPKFHREALNIAGNPKLGAPFGWPWSKDWFKPTDCRRDLVKAAALIVAEIERLDRIPK